MKSKVVSFLILIIVIFVLLTLTGAIFTVQETEQIIITQFGKPVGAPINEAGLHFKVPFIQDVHTIDKRVLQWDGPVAEMPTKDKLYIVVDTFARWRISDPMQFFIRLNDLRRARSRLDDILGSETRNTVARHELVEMIRTTKDRKAAIDDTLAAGGGTTSGGLPPIQFGRVALEKEITEEARGKLAEFGIELLDVRFKRINYNPAVSAKIYSRMMSERQQIAERFRSEGQGEAAKILGNKERDLKEIDSKAYREVQTVEGKADAEATAIYAKAYNQTPEARDLYQFQRTLDTYKTSFQGETTLILSTQSNFLRFLKGPTAGPSPTPAPAPPKPAP
ncbi:HflC protein [Chthoniobacter flavus Ellin428]|uniref:Protein HflC n=1 Tax=Chthoniobacter flavus Ellin428 TaxID=497964 RepID=B4D927_9BACT|nr:protease modulator HflC [Chthoniobacter flavus]EDY17072.1 HflC protein [Chthoniobacter flavus Ellin428]TCO86162.1 protease FtsH subunit HflC [Chthoniobacter flavus]